MQCLLLMTYLFLPVTGQLAHTCQVRRRCLRWGAPAPSVPQLRRWRLCPHHLQGARQLTRWQAYQLLHLRCCLDLVLSMSMLQEINPEMGTWEDVDNLAQHFDVTMVRASH